MAKYGSLKDYIEINHKEVILKGLNSFVRTESTDACISDINVLTLAWNKFDSESLSARYLTFTAGISAELTNIQDGSSAIHYYNITMRGNIRKQFYDLTVLGIDEVTTSSLQEESVFSLFGLPTNITAEELEETAEKFYVAYCPEELIDKNRRYTLPVVKIKDRIGCRMWYAKLPKNCLGRIFLNPSIADIYDTTTSITPVLFPDEDIPFGSILLNFSYYRIGNRTDDIIVSAHEFIHWHFHQPFMEIWMLINNRDYAECSTEALLPDDSMTAAEKAYWNAEWQANELSVRVAMPRHLVEEAISEYERDNGDCRHDGNYYQNMIYKLSWDFNVPEEIMKKRFRQLGYDYTDGTFVIIDGCYCQPFTFARGALKENETFVIYHANYERLLREDNRLAELIENRYYVYTGFVICKNDAKYVSPVSTDSGLNFSLSDYAREHADECCLMLTRHEKQCATTYTEFDYLNKLDDGTYSKDGELTHDAKNDWKSHKKMKEDEKEAQGILAEMAKANVVSFKDALRFHISRLKIKPEDMPDELYLKEATFSSYYKANRNPSLKRALIICNKLSLQYKLCIDLLKRARITLNTDEKEDEFYDYLLTITNATLDEWELYLRKNGFPPLVDESNGS